MPGIGEPSANWPSGGSGRAREAWKVRQDYSVDDYDYIDYLVFSARGKSWCIVEAWNAIIRF